jgi:Fe-S oxidoreductase
VLDVYSRASTGCARCASVCQVYQATGDPRDIPCYRSSLLLDVYRRHFTFHGWLQGKILGNGQLTEEHIDEMAEAFYHCTACRRCTIECPMGIDHGLLTHLGRYILSEIGMAPRALVVSVREQLQGKTGNTSAIPVPALLDTLEFLEEEIEEGKGVPVKFPIDQEGVEYVFFPAVSDFLMEADTLMGNAAVMHAAGARWTIGTGYYDGINYGLFYSDWVLQRVIDKLVAEVHRLKGQKILIGECGHASRSAKVFVPTFGGENPPPVINCMELTLQFIREGKLDLDRDAIPERVTYHDPCNIARSGWIIDQPRQILRAFVKDYVDMTPCGTENYCCGGGGGTVSLDEVHDYRMKVAGKRKAEQIRATGADLVVAPCANCKKQLREVLEHYEVPAQVVGLHDLILRAIRLT